MCIRDSPNVPVNTRPSVTDTRTVVPVSTKCFICSIAGFTDDDDDDDDSFLFVISNDDDDDM